MACNCIGGCPCPCQRGAWALSGAAPAIITTDVLTLLTQARTHGMTPKEKYEQTVSGVYGLLPMDSHITKKQIREMLADKGIVDPDPDQ